MCDIYIYKRLVLQHVLVTAKSHDEEQVIFMLEAYL